MHALGPGSGVGVFDASVPPQGGGGGGGGSIEAGGKRALPGCLIVLCSLGTDWMMGWGSFSSAVGSGGLLIDLFSVWGRGL